MLTAPAVNGGAILRIAGEFETHETDWPVQRPDLETPAADIETATAAAEILELPEVTELPIDQAQAATPPLWTTEDLQEMGRNVERWLRKNRPGLDEHAVAAVANAYTLDYK